MTLYGGSWVTRGSISMPGFVSVEEAEGNATPFNVGMLRTVISASPNWSPKAKYRDEAGCATLFVLLNAGQHPIDDLFDGVSVTLRYLRSTRSLWIILGVVA